MWNDPLSGCLAAGEKNSHLGRERERGGEEVEATEEYKVK